ncbi:MAG: hypothetical protein AB1779_11000 [Candidatus Thermoplasmatota archaeon]
MMKKKIVEQISNGKCSFCDGTFTKGKMKKHLESCKQRRAFSETSTDKQRSQKTKLFHIVAEGRHQPEYWMHIETSASAKLKDLDDFLRYIWLECCDHLSAFTIERTKYASYPDEWLNDKSMDVAIGDVLNPGLRFYHEYDFGTPTEITLKVLSQREGETMDEPIHLLARNEQPPITCDLCGKIATQVCRECGWSGDGGWLCDDCANKHECGEDLLLPVVNSPRVGICGYTGE